MIRRSRQDRWDILAPAVLLVLITACTTPEAVHGGPPADFSSLRSDNGLLAAPQLFEYRPSAEQSVYRLLLDQVANGDVALREAPAADSLAQLIRTQNEGVQRLWLLHLAGRFYGQALLAEADLRAIDVLLDPSGGLAPDAASVGNSSPEVRASATLRAYLAAASLGKTSLSLQTAVDSLVPSATFAGAALASLSRIPATAPTLSSDPSLPDAYYSLLAGRALQPQVVDLWLTRFENGQISPDEPGLLWLLSEIVREGRSDSTTSARLRSLIGLWQDYPRDRSGFHAQPRTIQGDSTTTYITMLTAAGRDFSVADRQLAEALRKIPDSSSETDIWEPVFTRLARALALSQQRASTPPATFPWKGTGGPNLLVTAAAARQAGEVGPVDVLGQWPHSEPFESARTAVALYLLTGSVPTWTNSWRAEWARVLDKPSPSNERQFMQIAALIASGTEEQRRDVAPQLERRLGSESGCGGVPWMNRLGPDVPECDLRTSFTAMIANLVAHPDKIDTVLGKRV